MWTGNIGGIQGGGRPETGECAEPTVVHRSSGCDQSASHILRKLIYADDLAVDTDSEADLQERLVEWRKPLVDMD